MMEVKAVMYFDKKLHHDLQGSKYAPDDDSNAWKIKQKKLPL